MIVERQFFLDVKIGAETTIDFDFAPGTLEDEAKQVLDKLRGLDFKQFKFKVCNVNLTAEVYDYIAGYIKKFAILDKVNVVSDKEFYIAFLVKFDRKDDGNEDERSN